MDTVAVEADVPNKGAHQEAENDFKLLKKYARKCNLQNKLLQRIVLAVIAELNASGQVVECDLENVTEETAESFLQKWKAFIALKADIELGDELATRAAVENGKDLLIADLEKKCQRCEETIEELRSRMAQLEMAARDKRHISPDDAEAVAVSGPDADLPVKSVRLTPDSRVVVTATAQEGKRSRCGSTDSALRGSGQDTSLLEDVLAACGEVASCGAAEDACASSDDKLPLDSEQNISSPPPYPADNEAAAGGGENPFDDNDELSQFADSGADRNQNTSLPVSGELASIDSAERAVKAAAENSSGASSASACRPALAASNGNPFDSSDEDEPSQPPISANTDSHAAAIAADASGAERERGHAASDDSDSEEDSQQCRKADPFMLTEWTMYSENHVVPLYGLNSPVVDHLLLSWTSDQRKIHYLISWINCLASPLPKKFPPGLQIVRVSDVVRDGFLILLLPLIRDISMHEVKAFARRSGYDKDVGAASEVKNDTAQRRLPEENERLYDVRFEVIREDFEEDETHSSPPPSVASTPVQSPQRVGAAAAAAAVDKPPSAPTDPCPPKPPVGSGGVWQSSLTSLLSPITSFWPVSAAGGAVAQSTPAVAASVDAREHEQDIQAPSPESKQDAKTGDAPVNYEFTKPSDLKSVPVKATPAAVTECAVPPPVKSKPRGAPPSGRIAERLATLRAANQK